MRRTLSLCALIVLAPTTFMIGDGWTAFGSGASGERLERMQSSPNWRDGVFVNGIALYNPFLDAPERWLDGSEFAKPKETPAALQTGPRVFEQSTPLRITWFGHSIALIELDGKRFLTDPVWSERVSPYSWLGPKRWYPPPIALEDLPPIDAVLISHDHYDHLDTHTIKALIGRVGLFVAPLGVGAHLEY